MSANLHNKVTKGETLLECKLACISRILAAAAKIMKEMHERREIEGRASGKRQCDHNLQMSALAFAEEFAQANKLCIISFK